MNLVDLYIQVVGSSEFCHLMSESIHAINEKAHRMELSIAKAESIESVLKSSSPVHVDFIAFLMNTGQRHCIEQVIICYFHWRTEPLKSYKFSDKQHLAY